ncbi:GDP-mannose mannosyl hydrolase [Acinetobacter soli]|uniref:GDP-mannose mannosyl hydrolase n=1 Tax=Acinetobacter soli TaxID=487316 RepID=UPI001ABC7BC4|nr:GDP-mannose mannosyl hydrolase [Acinetobacter soli]MBO3672639.1 GDP-mannose mannosyl hydrolase [Acinetobacter soli]
MWLPDQVFKTVISSTPLISIDLVVRNEKNEVLLGKRLNAPAKGFWFVPGGRVQKNETLDNAFIRLLREELGIESGIVREDANFTGVFEHFYSDNVFDDEVSTHYIVLGYEFIVNGKFLNYMPRLQHKDYKFFSDEMLLENRNVHRYTKNYFLTSN